MEGKNDPNHTYAMNYSFHPEIQTKQEIKELFNIQRDFLLSSFNSTLEFEKIIQLNNSQGRHLFITIDESDLKTNYKMYFKNGIFYRVAVVTKHGNLFNKNISKFLNSFKIFD